MSASTSAGSQRQPETIEQFAVRIARQVSAERSVHPRDAEAGIRAAIACGQIAVDEAGRVLGRTIEPELAAALDAFAPLTS